MKKPALEPQTVLYNGVIATQNDALPSARAVAVGNGKILALGHDEQILDIAGPGTEKIDLHDRLVVPGFIDTHIHFYEWALKRQGLRLDDLNSLQELLNRVQETARRLPQGQWIVGQGWNETDWAEPAVPTRELLDRSAPDHPVLLWRCDLHMAAANSAALELTGITADTQDPPDGRIERDSNGAPTGILRELAINLVRQAFAPPGKAEVIDAFEDAAKALHRRGVTGIHDVRLMADKDGAQAFQAFRQLDHDGRLDLRCWVTLPGHLMDDAIRLGLQTGFGSDRLRLGHIKFFSDGGMGARTAWMIDPFLDAGHGMPLMDMTELSEQIDRADRAGLSVMVHAVGDRANRELVNIFEALRDRRNHEGVPPLSIPHRIEHVQMIRPEDADRLGNLNIGLCVTPANMVLDINLIDFAVGERGQWTYAFRRLMDTGAPVMFSSDCPVCDPDPLAGIHAAVTRQRTDGTPIGGWHPESKVTVAEALKAYTATPASFHDSGNLLGTITPNNKADMVVLSENILEMPPAEIPKTQIDMTLFEGIVVHRRC